MQRFTATSFSAVLAVALLTGAKPAVKLESRKGLPDGLAKKVAAKLNPAGYRISTAKGVLCEIWFAKNLPVKAGFKPTLSAKYPFTPGQLVGAIRIGKAGTYTDFKGQEMKPGVYTLRYGLQPEDGNHIGTSETADFFLALSAKTDTDPKLISLKETFHKRSAKAAGSTHPAIFSLLPPQKGGKAGLSHNEDKNLWILTATIATKAKGVKTKLTVRLVAVGKSEE